jgi:hypothetical protein
VALQFKLIDSLYVHQDLATVDSILLRELPPVEDAQAVSFIHYFPPTTPPPPHDKHM